MFGVQRLVSLSPDNYEPPKSLLFLPSVAYGAAGFEMRSCLVLWVCWLPEREVGRRNTPGEGLLKWKAEMESAG